MKEMVLLTFCMSQFFDLGKIQPLKFFLRRKKKSGFSAKISCSQTLFCKTLTGMKDDQGSKW